MAAPSTAQITVTAPVGAGETATAETLSNIRAVKFDIEQEMLFVTTEDGRVVEFAYDTIATVTYVIAAKHATITVST